MKAYKLILTVACAVFILAGPTAYGATRTWDRVDVNGDFASGNYNTAANWSGDTVPISTDDAVLPNQTGGAARYTVTMDASPGAAKFLTVGTDATLLIATGNTLQLGSGATALTSTIASTGRIELQGSGSALDYRTVSHTVSGAGEIDGQAGAPKISIASGITLTGGVKISGQMSIEGAGSFTNDGRVVADNANGRLDITVTGTIDDTANTGAVTSSNNRWAVENSTAELRFSVDAAAMEGHFHVSAGTLRAGRDVPADAIDVCTTGDLLHTGGTIFAGVNDFFKFGGTCP